MCHCAGTVLYCSSTCTPWPPLTRIENCADSAARVQVLILPSRRLLGCTRAVGADLQLHVSILARSGPLRVWLSGVWRVWSLPHLWLTAPNSNPIPLFALHRSLESSGVHGHMGTPRRAGLTCHRPCQPMSGDSDTRGFETETATGQGHKAAAALAATRPTHAGKNAYKRAGRFLQAPFEMGR